MTGIVLQLQEDCLRPDLSISPLLRKAKVIASKLNVPEFENWIDSELGGYKGALVNLPSHRVGMGQPKFFNPYHGWLDVVTGNDDVSSIISTARLPQPVAELENLIVSGKGTHVILGYPPVIIEFLNKANGLDFNYGLHISKSFIHGSLEYARNTTLEWTLQLEKRGVIGENFSFSTAEKEAAKIVTNHIYNSNIGVIGSVSGDANNSHFNTNGNIDYKKLEVLISKIEEAAPGLPGHISYEINSLIEELRSAVENRDSGRVSRAIRSVRTVLEGAGGSLVASGILAALGG